MGLPGLNKGFKKSNSSLHHVDFVKKEKKRKPFKWHFLIKNLVFKLLNVCLLREFSVCKLRKMKEKRKRKVKTWQQNKNGNKIYLFSPRLGLYKSPQTTNICEASAFPSAQLSRWRQDQWEIWMCVLCYTAGFTP